MRTKKIITILFAGLLFISGHAFQSRDSVLQVIKEKGAKARLLTDAQPDSAIFFYQQAISIMDQDGGLHLNSPNDSLHIYRIRFLNKIGIIFHQQSKYSFAENYCQKALEAAQSVNNDSILGECHFSLAEVALENGAYVSAIQSYSKALELWEKTGYVDGVFWTHIGLGIIYRETGNSERSQHHYEKARQLGYDHDIESYIGICNNNLGNLFRQKGDYERAISYLQEALASFKIMQNERYISDCLSSIGTVYLDYGDTKRSIEYYQQSLELAEKLDDKYRLLGLYANLGNAWSISGEKEQALMYFSKTLELAQAVGDKARLSEIYIVISEFYQKNKDFENARNNLDKALEIARETGDSVSVAAALTTLSELYLSHGDEPTALPLALDAFHIARRKGLLKTAEQSAENLAEIYEKQKNFKQAYHFTRIANAINDSLLNGEKIRILEETQAKYDLERIESEKLLTENAKLLAEQKLANMKYILTLLGLVVIVLTILFGRYLRGKKRDKDDAGKRALQLSQKIDLLNSQLDEKNRELTSKAMMISQNNQTISVISDAIDAYLVNGDRQELRKLQNQLKDTVEEGSWNDFIKHFQEVHPQFYQNLSEKYPDLTSNEQKICAFLRMNLNSKEISQITGQSVKSIEVARTRIRKKLAVEHNENLAAIIQKI